MHVENEETQFDNLNDLFHYDGEEEDTESFIEGFEGFDGVPSEHQEEGKSEESLEFEDEDIEPNNDDTDGIDFESEGSGSDDDDFDIEAINRRLKTNFKDEEELKKFMNEKQEKEEVDEEESRFAESSRNIEIYDPIVKLRDRDLMRRQFETIASQEGKDITDDYVKMDIEDQIEDLISQGTLGDEARMLREAIQEKILDPAKKTVNEITQKREQAKKEAEENERKEFQNSLLAIAQQENFYGVNVQKEDIVSVYKDRDKFLELLSKDKAALAEVAMMYKYKDKIYKKASGRTYGEGMRDILNEYKTRREDRSLSKAQRRGSSGGSDRSKDIISGLLYSKPENES